METAMINFDVTVIGGGPAGLAAAIEASGAGAKVLLIEREAKLGGVLKQCIHDGFGVIRFGEKLSGCEYACRFIHEIKNTDVTIATMTFVSKILKTPEGFQLSLTGSGGFKHVNSKTLVLATGCRERTARQVAIHGTRPAGLITAGAAQYHINIQGHLPGRRCVILGSGDIGLIMARRLTLEGSEVIGVYEAKAEPSGLSRNIYQCLVDFDIPLYLSRTVTEVHGRERVEGVTVADVNEKMEPVPGTEEYIPCDSLILSVGLIPENELAETLGVELDRSTRGAVCDQSYMTSVPGVFACGNALHVNDLVDYVSESGEKAGRGAAEFALASGTSSSEHLKTRPSDYLNIRPSEDFLYVVPQKISFRQGIQKVQGVQDAQGVQKVQGVQDAQGVKHVQEEKTEFYFRTRRTRGRTTVIVMVDGTEIYRGRYQSLRPPEMEKITIDLSAFNVENAEIVDFVMEEAGNE